MSKLISSNIKKVAWLIQVLGSQLIDQSQSLWWFVLSHQKRFLATYNLVNTVWDYKRKSLLLKRPEAIEKSLLKTYSFPWELAYHKKINLLPGLEYNAAPKGEPDRVHIFFPVCYRKSRTWFLVALKGEGWLQKACGTLKDSCSLSKEKKKVFLLKKWLLAMEIDFYIANHFEKLICYTLVTRLDSTLSQRGKIQLNTGWNLHSLSEEHYALAVLWWLYSFWFLW